VFTSVEGFVTTVKAFKPAAAKTDLSPVFSVPEPTLDNDKPIKRIPAPAVQSCEILWEDKDRAVIFAIADPQTEESVPSRVGVLFLLSRKEDRWQISDHLRFTASGKYASISAKQTAEVGAGNSFESLGVGPVITITQGQGGRGLFYTTSVSYRLNKSRFERNGGPD
jgi:hypothetical protein